MKSVILMLIITVFSSLDLYAQPLPPSDTDPGGDGVPIDGGITLLAIAGAGYGISKLRQQKKAGNNSILFAYPTKKQ